MGKVIQTWDNVSVSLLDDGTYTITQQDGSSGILTSATVSDNLVIDEMSLLKIMLIGTAGYMSRGILDCLVAKRNNKIKNLGDCLKVTLLP
jgi:hypothetical protein